MASQKYYVFSVMHVRRSTYTEYIRGSLLRVVQCALAFRCKATDICAREPLLDAVETSALYGAGCRRRHRRRVPSPSPAPRAVFGTVRGRRHRALSRRAAIPPLWRTLPTLSAVGCCAACARRLLPHSSCCCTLKTSKML